MAIQGATLPDMSPWIASLPLAMTVCGETRSDRSETVSNRWDASSGAVAVLDCFA
ncbi:MAG: hypothetical protein PGN25_09320 [Methylorubrum populi]